MYNLLHRVKYIRAHTKIYFWIVLSCDLPADFSGGLQQPGGSIFCLDLHTKKYREEMTSSCDFLSPKPSTKESSEDTVAT